MFKFIRWLIGFCIFIAICLFALYCTICIVFPIKYIDTIEKYSQKYDLDPAFVCAIIKRKVTLSQRLLLTKVLWG